MKLPSGKEVSDKSLRQVVEAIVLVYASYGFEDFGSAVHDISHDLSNEVFDEPDLLGLTEPDIVTILDAVVPLVREVGLALGDAYTKLSEEKIEHHIWNGK